MNRRSTTPIGTVNKGITSKKINFAKPEDSIYASKLINRLFATLTRTSFKFKVYNLQIYR